MISGTPPLSSPYTLRRRIRDAVVSFPKWLYTLFNVPGFVSPIDYPDRVTGDYIRIRVNQRFTVISVNNRDYFFRRLTGRFDGTGYAVCNPTTEEQLYYILDDTLESTHPLSLWGRLKALLRSIGRGYSS